MGPHSGTHMTVLDEQWWKAAGWVQSLGEHQPSLRTLHCTPHQHGHGSWHWNTFPVPGALPTHPHQVFSVPTKWSSWAPGQMPSPGLQKPCKVSCWQLDTFLAAAWKQRLHLLCLYLGQSQTGNHQLTPPVWQGRPQSSPGLSWPVLSTWDHSSYPFPMHPPYSCRDNETLLPVGGYLAIEDDCSCQVTDQRGAHVTRCSNHLHHYAWWGRCFTCLQVQCSIVIISNGLRHILSWCH